MKRIAFRVVPVVALLAAGFAWVGPRLSGQSTGQPSTSNGEWPMYTADLRGSKYSPLDQIDAGNFSKMEVAWRFKTDNLGPRPETKLEGTPLMVKGTLYATAGTRRAVIALDPRTGEQKWVYSLDEGERATRWAPRQLSGRGLSYWTDGKGDERVIYVTTGYRLVSLNAKTGQPIPNFGDKGMVDLKVGIMHGKNGKQVQIDLEKGEIGLHSTPTVADDLIIVGSSMFEGLGYLYSNNAKGHVRAFDVRTGKQMWRFDTMPGPGEPGHETWENGSWAWTGNTGVWTQITVDPEAGLVYLPVETPTIDEYGGNRPGDNLYAESLVAVDLKTGSEEVALPVRASPDVGSRHVVGAAPDGRHDRWQAAQGRRRAVEAGLALCVRSHHRPADLADRRASRCRRATCPGEKTAKTQPFPTKPPAYSRTHVAESDLIDFTPALRTQALENLKLFRWEQIPYVPPVGPNSKLLGTINIANTSGGVNWPGSGFDPETGIFYTQAGNSAVTVAKYDRGRVPPCEPGKSEAIGYPRWEAEPDYGTAIRGRFTAAVARGGPWRRRAAARPWHSGQRTSGARVRGTRRIVDRQAALRRDGGHRCQQGRPAVAGAARRYAGQRAQSRVAQGHEHPEDRSERQRRRAGHQDACDRRRSAVHDPGTACVARCCARMTRRPARRLARSDARRHQRSPMTYSVDGRQYIVVAVSGAGYTGEYISFACRSPRCAPRPPCGAVTYGTDQSMEGREQSRPSRRDAAPSTR